MGEPDIPEPRPITVVSAAGYAVLHLLGVLLVYALLAATGGEDPESSWVHIAAATLLVSLGVLYLALSRHAPGEPTWAAVGLTTPRGGREWRVLALALGFGIGLVPVAAELTARLAAVWPAGQGDAEAEEQTRRILATSTPVRWIANGVLVTLVPLVEEALYRGLLQKRMVGVTAVRAAVTVALVYVVAHTDPRALPATLLLALGLALTRLVARTTWPAVAAHVVHLALPFALVLVSSGGALDPSSIDAGGDPVPPPWVLGGAAVVATTSFVLWTMRPRSIA
jgi:membrane protease YdiL (CAAX protease family)